MAQTLPYMSADLIEMLDKLYPARPPSLTDTERMVWFNAGRRDIVECLLKLQERTDNNILKGDN